jgi:excisionase family DNA binding protein
MAKQRKRRDDETALFVRLPREEAEKLDRFVFERRIPKRDVVRRLVAEHLDEADVIWQRPAPPPIPVTIPPDADFVVGRADFVPTEAPEVLDVDEVAELLQVQADAVRDLAEAGELPGRKIGDDWRFLRRAVLAWLGGATPPDRAA